MKVILANVRLAFPDLFTAKAFEEGKTAYYGATFPIEPDSENGNKIISAMKSVAKEKWKEKAAFVYQDLLKRNKACFSKDEKHREGVIYDGFHDMWSIRASTKTRPRVYAKNPEYFLTQDDGVIYPGCYVNAAVDIWAQANSFGQRINASLLSVQFAADGDAFGAGERSTADDFANLEDTGATASVAGDDFDNLI